MSDFAIMPNQVRWSAESLKDFRVPEESKKFLQITGLPESIDFTTFEFGVFDSDGELVIGADYEYPIVIRADGEVIEEAPDGELLFNSSVQQLSRCLKLYIELKITKSVGVLLRDEFERVKAEMSRIDPAGMEVSGGTIWPMVLRDFEALGLG